MAKRSLDVCIEDVTDIYDGPGGALWEMLMGEQIHVGGERETDVLADKAGITSSSAVLDVCSALGGPARHLARTRGCRVVGLDAAATMHSAAVRRTKDAGLESHVSFKLGNAIDMPFKSGSFDVAWGQDAWCYVTDKARLLRECARVVRPGGVVAFTDWMETGDLRDDEWTALNTFMMFPHLETLSGYVDLARAAGLEVTDSEDLTPDFARHVQGYLDAFTHQHRAAVVNVYGQEMYEAVEQGLTMWRDASAAGQVGRGRVIARKAA